MAQFNGWRIGAQYSPEEADQLEPLVDVLLEVLPYALELPGLDMSPHNTIGDVVARIGAAANMTNKISRAQPEEVPTQEVVEQVATLRNIWLSVVLYSARAVLQIDMIMAAVEKTKSENNISNQ